MYFGTILKEIHAVKHVVRKYINVYIHTEDSSHKDNICTYVVNSNFTSTVQEYF